MKRRDVIRWLAGAAGLAAARPVLAQAPRTDRIRRVAILSISAQSDPDGQARLGAFLNAMQSMGWIEGRNIQYEYRGGASNAARAAALGAELIASAPEVILVNGTPGVTALQKATRTIPVVFVVVTDPVGAGFVQSQARPGANITGFSTFEPEIGGKWLELLKGIAPGIRRVAGILDPQFQGFARIWNAVETAAARSRIELTALPLREAGDDIESTVGQFANGSAAGLITLPTAVNNRARTRLIALSAKHRLPAVYPFRHYAVEGGLMAYGFQPVDLWRRSASYVDRILKGEMPADLPVQSPTKYELVINRRTAKNIGLSVPKAMLVQADKLID